MPSSTQRYEASIPKTDERLAQVGGRGWTHSAGSDMTFSATEIGLGVMGRLRGS
jgi:hypothetical protein